MYPNLKFCEEVSKLKCSICNENLIPVHHSGAGIYIATCKNIKTHKFEIGPFLTANKLFKYINNKTA